MKSVEFCREVSDQKLISLLAPYLFSISLAICTYCFSASSFDIPFLLHQASHLSLSYDSTFSTGLDVVQSPSVACL